jgi:hypothetical protein
MQGSDKGEGREGRCAHAERLRVVVDKVRQDGHAHLPPSWVRLCPRSSAE